MKTAAALALLTALAMPATAQIEGDPRQKMLEILDEVAHEMKQIDKWLQESSRSKDAAKGLKHNIDRMNKLLDSVGKSQKQVVQSIDDLLKEAEKMKGKGQGGPSSMPKPGQGRGRQQQEERQRQRSGRQPRRLQTPQPNPQDEPNDTQRNGRNRRPERDKGKNVDSRDPKKGATERVDGKKIPGAWGALPDYILKHGRGSMPEVPQKYRKYLEAITKQDQKKQGK